MENRRPSGVAFRTVPDALGELSGPAAQREKQEEREDCGDEEDLQRDHGMTPAVTPFTPTLTSVERIKSANIWTFAISTG